MLGKILNQRYKIISEIGEGGMATVYLAMDQTLQREVAIKILHPHLAKDSDLNHRFKQEASIAAQLDHPNILKIFDFGADTDERSYIVSEVIRGQDFHLLQLERQRNGLNAFDPRVCAMVCEEVLRGLAEAHAMNFVHRDIKPDNIMITENGDVKVTDFGIAKNLSSSITVIGQFLGSPSYSSPEQVQGNPVDFRSDLYSLGIILYEALTNRLPFNGRSASEVMLKICKGTYSPLHKVKPQVPVELERIVSRALSLNRHDRFSSTALMIKEFRNFLASSGIENSRAGLESYFKDGDRFLNSLREKPILSTPDFPARILTLSQPRFGSSENRRGPQAPPAHGSKPKAYSAPKNLKKNSQSSVPIFFVGILALGATLAGLFFVLPANIPKPQVNNSPIHSSAPALPSRSPITRPLLRPEVSSRPLEKDVPVPAIRTTPPAPRRIPPPPFREPVVAHKAPEIGRNEHRTASVGGAFQALPTPAAPIRPTPSEMVRIPPEIRPTPEIKVTAEPRIVAEPIPTRLALQTIPANLPIFINGRLLGHSGRDGESKIFEIKPGKVQIRIPAQDIAGTRYERFERTTFVDSTKLLNLGVLRMIPLRTLTLNISGPSVIVRVNENPYALTGKALVLQLPEGRVEIDARAQNGKSMHRSIDLKGENFTMNSTLE